MNISEVELEAYQYVKANKKDLIKRFADVTTFPPVEKPVTIIMAGSPGAGKTEFSKSLQNKFFEFYGPDPSARTVRIDADEIREVIPGYTGENAHLFQRAASKGVEILIDQVMHKSQNAIIDGTFAHYESSIKNVIRSLFRDIPRVTEIYYIYQDPRIAWDFTKKREALEKRKITKNAFIEGYYKALENVRKAKQEFQNQIKVNLIIKDEFNDRTKNYFNIENIDNYLKIEYNRTQLEKILL